MNLILRDRTLISIQCAVSAIGLYPVSQGLIRIFSTRIFADFPKGIYPHAALFFYPEKKFELVGYLLFVVLFAIYALSAGALAQRMPEDRPSARGVPLRLVIMCSCSVLPWFLPPPWSCIVWLAGSLVPIWVVDLVRSRHVG